MPEEHALAKLEAEFCPPLDPALLQAILGDYDLSDDEGVRAARAILEPLKESAQIEEAAGFDPSGTGGVQDENGPPRANGEHPGSATDEASADASRDTDVTSLSNGLSSLDLEREWMRRDIPGDLGSAEELERLDTDTKVLLLQDVFGSSLSKFTIRHTLEKCNGRWNAALDELMNHVYFAEVEDSDSGARTPSKGIEAFSEDNVIRSSKKKRKGAKQNQRRRLMNESRPSTPVASEDAASAGTNRWQDAGKDVAFITECTGLSAKTVSSTYYANNAGLSQTIGSLLKSHIASDDGLEKDVLVTRNAQELGQDFPIIARNYLIAIIEITQPSTSAAHELAKALTAPPKYSSRDAMLIPQYAPAQVTVDGGSDDRSEPLMASIGTGNLVPQYATARAQAFNQARAAHRKAKSDNLMGGAAAYYGQLGRDQTALLHQATAAAADSLAASQSTHAQLDLHGVDVLNGVRIARDRVHEWWEGLGESRVNGRIGVDDRQAGYRIVVGLGRHSEGGKGKLGPAVTKMLRSEGWRFDGTGAVIVVSGKVK
ncbi:hypothetical protein K431DRAFT_306083 [Polychaeton citri CBS 116435]|uniref:Smr domain-containing protein n=1 Tax=Polychaeton citri CBS 116435 TaxID=1314669 RepID=A0A9P4UJW3_9PEZI|nr:hypothetical protein K431DRAFT_306083 [Polychaeton citri CBS 116435]